MQKCVVKFEYPYIDIWIGGCSVYILVFGI